MRFPTSHCYSPPPHFPARIPLNCTLKLNAGQLQTIRAALARREGLKKRLENSPSFSSCPKGVGHMGRSRQGSSVLAVALQQTLLVTLPFATPSLLPSPPSPFAHSVAFCNFLCCLCLFERPVRRILKALRVAWAWQGGRGRRVTMTKDCSAKSLPKR